MSSDEIDVVYTWVNGAWPGYHDLLSSYATNRHDLNPNRYRDNLELLKYSLRSLQMYAPWASRVFVVTCRPQIPSWLNPGAPGLRIVHHDEFMAAEHLPTFNSLAIVSNLHRLPGLGGRFIYFEDDMLLGAQVTPDHFFFPDGTTRVFRQRTLSTPAWYHGRSGLTPWQAAQAHANTLLDDAYGFALRRSVVHVPLYVDVELWRSMIARWPGAFGHTSASRFRAAGNVAPEHLFPYYQVYEGRAAFASRRFRRARTSYHGIDNWFWFQRRAFRRLARRRPPVYCLNDNFGERENPEVVRLVRRYLETMYPSPSRFEASDP